MTHSIAANCDIFHHKFILEFVYLHDYGAAHAEVHSNASLHAEAKFMQSISFQYTFNCMHHYYLHFRAVYWQAALAW